MNMPPGKWFNEGQLTPHSTVVTTVPSALKLWKELHALPVEQETFMVSV
jgi:hypothetical protein